MDLQLIEKEALEALEQSKSIPEVDVLYTRVLGRKEGQLTQILKTLGTLSPEEKKSVGKAANQLRSLLENKIAEKKKTLQTQSVASSLAKEKIDLTLPGTPLSLGHSHLIIQTIQEISHIFKSIGFDVVDGPEIESDHNNFAALNIPDNHPAKDMHDTFYLNASEKDIGESGHKNLLLRTHTSPVQIRLMKSVKPPVRIIAPGRVYRHEAVDATHAAIFHQVEGLAIDKNITFADLKGTLSHFARQYFGTKTKVRFRPSYFPFVEPGAEMDVEWGRGWLEMLGAGMVHPQVLRNVGYDPEKYTGFAFGMGIERIVMTRYQIPDIRIFLESDLRFLEQYA